MTNNNVNSFAENMSDMVKSSAEILNMANAINQSVSSSEVSVTLSDGLTIPSYSTVIDRLSKVENTMSQFTQGSGNIQTDDGTYRKIKVSTISKAPNKITGISDVSTFNINPNWFFESLQYPRCIVQIDLTDKIDETSDRVYVDRVILDLTDTVAGSINMREFYSTNILNKDLSYSSLVSILINNNISYKEDKDEVKLPLTYEKYYGIFNITGSQLIKGNDGISRIWYYLNTLNYSTVDEAGLEENNGHILTVGDYVRYDDSLFKVIEIVQDEKRIRLEGSIGFQTLGIYDNLYFYNAPFSEKTINVGIGINEINIIYVKAVNEDYNLLSKTWSDPITFITNDLTFDENETLTFDTYYNKNVADFGRDWIAQAKEKHIYSYNGVKPYAPVLNESDMQVVQINTQLQTTLDTERYNNLTSEISSIKTNITTTRNTISKNKDLLLQLSNSAERENIQNIINSDTTTLSSLSTRYNSLVEELNTLLNDAGAISYTPKYHVRGFFGIPDNNENQQVIGFEIMYRYLHTDETGVKLDTYQYNSNDSVLSGVFSDWNLVTSRILEKKYNEDTDTYYWSHTNTLDGSEININQIDIAIRSGEKVEIKARSISEAGYPYNPLKSDWSNSIIISFPDNLTSNDSVTTVLNTVKNDMTAITLQNTISAAGVYTHLSDTNSTFKHDARNLQYNEITVDSSNNTVITAMTVEDKLKLLSEKFSEKVDENSFESKVVEILKKYDCLKDKQ
jgi:hypothetical protein